MGLMEIVVSYHSFLARSLPVIDVILRLPLSLSCGWLFLVAVIVYVYVHYCKPFEYYLGAAGAGNKHQIGKCTHVVVTGGSQGIGLEVAKEYVRQGANVTIVARNVKTLASAVEILRACAKEKYPDPENGQGGGGVIFDRRFAACLWTARRLRISFAARLWIARFQIATFSSTALARRWLVLSTSSRTTLLRICCASTCWGASSPLGS